MRAKLYKLRELQEAAVSGHPNLSLTGFAKRKGQIQWGKCFCSNKTEETIKEETARENVGLKHDVFLAQK
jgi:hypothetical protein